MVTCVCPTGPSRSEWLVKSIDCFLKQTYEDRELLLVVEPGYIPKVPDDGRIRVLEVPHLMRLGAKRNFACLNAAELIAHWDDDDWSAPGRLTDQVERLQASGKAVTGYSLMKFTDGKNWWRYQGDRTWPLGTSLLFTKEWWGKHPFPDVQVASDNTFITMARQAGQVCYAETGDRMYATVHAGNMTKRSYGNNSFYPIPESEAVCL